MTAPQWLADTFVYWGRHLERLRRPPIGLTLAAVALAALTFVLTRIASGAQILDVALLYLLLTLIAAALWGYLVGLSVAVVAELLVNFYFVQPIHTFAVQEPRNVIALLVFLAVASIGASMLARLRREVALSRAREAEAHSLLDMAQRAAELERADEFKSLLLSSVSHDLRSPLTAIKAAIGSLRDRNVDWSEDDTHAFLETIEGQTDRLTAIVTDLLQMSRLESGTVRTEIEPIEVIALLDDAAQAGAAVCTGRVVTVEAPAALWVAADYGLLMQALGNLIENAAKYSRAGGPIQILGRKQVSSICLTVRDEGPGIAGTDAYRVFEKFYRGVSARDSKGTGLGLSIVKAMVELCGGTVSVQSSLHETEFAILLPEAAAPR